MRGVTPGRGLEGSPGVLVLFRNLQADMGLFWGRLLSYTLSIWALVSVYNSIKHLL